MHNICRQMAMLRVVKRLGTFSTFRKPPRGTHDLSVLIFADAARPSAHAQIGFVGGLLIGTPTHGSVLHTVSWASHFSKRPVKSSGSGVVLAAGDAIDTGKVIAIIYSSLLGMDVYLYVIVDSKDLYDSLSTCRTPEDKSIRTDLQLLRYNFETHQLNKSIWIPGNANRADALTKHDSALSEKLQLMLFDGTVPVTFDISASRSSDASLG